jgi:hypothetical protein
LWGEPLDYVPHSFEECQDSWASVAQPTLPPPFPTDSGLFLPLALGAGLLIETTLPELRVEAGALDLPLEPAKSPVEAFVILNNHFQTDHTPFEVSPKISTLS